MAELPLFRRLYERYHAQGLDVLVVSADVGMDDQLKKFVTKNPMPFPVLPSNADMREDYGDVHEVPVTLLIDRTGRIYRRYQGAREQPVFERDVQSLLKQPTT